MLWQDLGSRDIVTAAFAPVSVSLWISYRQSRLRHGLARSPATAT